MNTTLTSLSRADETTIAVAGRGSRQLTLALAGNPNTGKTSVFNALTGLHQKVANYAGVTVDRKEGSWVLAEGVPPARLIDLPGLYSLDAASPDEFIARDALVGEIEQTPLPDVIVAVTDATNLERNLYLVAQLLEINRPLVIALTMVDLAERAKLEVDAVKLSVALGVRVVQVTAKQRRGLNELAQAVLEAADSEPPTAKWHVSPQAEEEIERLSLRGTGGREAAMHDLYAHDLPSDEVRRRQIVEARERLAHFNPQWWQELVTARYEWIGKVTSDVVRGGPTQRIEQSTTDRVDWILTHRFFGPLVLLFVMLIVFQIIFSWAQLPMDLIDRGFGKLGELVRTSMPPGLLTDLLVDGVIAGVGGVLIFVPQILLLFFFIAILEDTGYMARAAFLMDKLMRCVGLQGKAFMPLLSSFACNVPGIMATRTIENRKERLAMIMIAPFMSCSARLPVYTLMIAAFFTGQQKIWGVLSVGVLIIMAMYLLGVTVAVIVAWILKHTILKSSSQPLILELPPYRMPSLMDIVQTMRWRAWIFVRRGGTVIMAISILLWASVTFPRVGISKVDANTESMSFQALSGIEGTQKVDPAMTTNTLPEESAQAGEQLRQSYAGQLGHLIEPAIAPLGFDWKIGIGLISSFAARETLVSTMSIVYNVSADATEESDSLIGAVRNARRADGTPAWTPLVAVSMMVFFVLACQCMSTVAVVRRETNSWRWPLFMVSYMLVLAYVASLITYQGGCLLGLS